MYTHISFVSTQTFFRNCTFRFNNKSSISLDLFVVVVFFIFLSSSLSVFLQPFGIFPFDDQQCRTHCAIILSIFAAAICNDDKSSSTCMFTITIKITHIHTKTLRIHISRKYSMKLKYLKKTGALFSLSLYRINDVNIEQCFVKSSARINMVSQKTIEIFILKWLLTINITNDRNMARELHLNVNIQSMFSLIWKISW